MKVVTGGTHRKQEEIKKREKVGKVKEWKEDEERRKDRLGHYGDELGGVCRPQRCSWQIGTLTLVDLQVDAQNSYLFTYNTPIKILYMFRALPCSSSGSLRRNCIYAASGIVTVYRWLSCAPVKKELLSLQFFLNRCTGQSPADSDDTRGCIYTITT